MQYLEEIGAINRKNEKLSQEIKTIYLEKQSLKELNSIKDQEITTKNKKFEVFMSEFQEKFTKMKEQLEQEEKSKNSLINEQKELLIKYKQVIFAILFNKTNNYLK